MPFDAPCHPSELCVPRVVYIVRGRPGQNDRPALPAGHPITWGAITKATLLDGAEYPFPVFLD